MEGLKTFSRGISQRFNIYRTVTAVGFIVFVILVMIIPARMSGASPWAYYYGVKNFSQGKLVLTDRELFQDILDAQRQGGFLMQYVKIGDNRWAVEKASGYIFYLVPFKWLGIPRWGNILLAAGMVVVLYLLLKRIRDEKTACIGAPLILFAPIGLIMANRAYMDTFASLAFLVMGGGLYFYYLLQKEKRGPVWGGIILFLAFFFIGWSVVTRQSNLLIAIVLALHYGVIRLKALFRSDKAWLRTELPAILLGAGLAAVALMIYNYTVFGSPLDYGYKYTPFPVKFAYEYLGQVDAAGASIPLNIILNNFKSMPIPLLQGFPVLILFVPAAVFIGIWKFMHRHQESTGLWAGLEKEIPWGTLAVLAGWFLSVYGLYWMYEYTAGFLPAGTSFFRYSRYYLPGLFPLVFISALVLGRFPRKVIIPVMGLVFISAVVFYVQVAMNINA